MNKTVLIVDDDKRIAALIEFRLRRQGYSTHCVYRGREAIDSMAVSQPVLVMLDIRLPDMNGVEVLKVLKRDHPHTYVIMISAHADVKLAVDCMKYGAYDFIEKPLAFPELDAKVHHVFSHLLLEEEVSMLKRELGEKYKYKSIVGKSEAMRHVFHCVDIAARSDAHVLIEGESGTGKELVARAVHFSNPQRRGSFVAVNCGAIPANLLESELFGYEKGAFTGAVAQRLGKFEQADRGTLFLDEIGELPLPLQVKLLRVLQEKEVERLGGSEPVPVNVRIIAATNRNLKHLIREGSFREDLYFRLNVFPIRIPPLRDRREDIPQLLQYFLSKHRGNEQASVRIAPSVLKSFIERRWPGNVREVENFVERLILVKGETEEITPEDLSLLEDFDMSDASGQLVGNLSDKDRILGETEKSLFVSALRETNGNVSRASKILQISRDTFYRKMKKYAIHR